MISGKAASYLSQGVKKKMIKPRNFLFGLILIGFVAELFSAINILLLPPAAGYELSIYSALPIAFWIPFLASTVIFIFVAVFLSSPTEVEAKLFWVLVMTGIIINTALILFLPDLRGYYSKGLGDFSYHISQSEKIANNGVIDHKIFYPISYAIVQMIHVFTGVSVETIWKIGDIGIYVIYVLFVGLAAGAVFEKRNQPVLIASLAGAIIVAGAYAPSLIPSNFSVVMLPLMIYLYIEARNAKRAANHIPFLLGLMLYPFLHPLTSLLLIGFLLSIEGGRWFVSFLLNRKAERALLKEREIIRLADVSNRFNANSALILSITWFLWFSSFSLWNYNVRRIFAWIKSETVAELSPGTQLSKIAYLASRAQFSTLDAVWLILKDKGGVLLYTGLAVVLLIMLLMRLKGREYLFNRGKFIIGIYAALFLMIIVTGIVLVGPFGDLDTSRMLRFIVPFATILIGLAAVDAVPLKSFVVKPILFLFFAVAGVGGILALHPSPYLFQPNGQVTFQDSACTSWVITHNQDQPITGIWNIKRYIDLAATSTNREVYPKVRANPLPERFGYDENAYVADLLGTEIVFPIMAYDRETTLNLWPMADKFRQADFDRLEIDPSVLKVYDNGECQVWVSRPLTDENAVSDR